MPRSEPLSGTSSRLPSYDDDFVEWTRHTAALLRAGRNVEIDLGHLAEEVEDMGKRDRRALEARLQVLLVHLLKWQHQPARRSGSWRGTIRTQRSRMKRILRDSPSLRVALPDVLQEVYPEAVAVAVDQTGLLDATFPKRCSYGLDELLDAEFLPD